MRVHLKLRKPSAGRFDLIGSFVVLPQRGDYIKEGEATYVVECVVHDVTGGKTTVSIYADYQSLLDRDGDLLK